MRIIGTGTTDSQQITNHRSWPMALYTTTFLFLNEIMINKNKLNVSKQERTTKI